MFISQKWLWIFDKTKNVVAKSCLLAWCLELHKQEPLHSKIECDCKKVTVEIKKILKDAVLLLDIKHHDDFRKMKRVGQQTFIYLHGVVPENIIQIRNFLKPIENIVKNSFYIKTGVKSIIRARTHTKYDKKTNKLLRKKWNKKSFVPKQMESKSNVADVVKFMVK